MKERIDKAAVVARIALSALAFSSGAVESTYAASPKHPTEHAAIHQTPEDIAAMQKVIADFKSYTLGQAEKDGYMPDGDCITGDEIGIEGKGDMMYHAENAKLEDTFDPQHPQVVIYPGIKDMNATPIAIEWEKDITSKDQKPPTLFGIEFGFMEGHRMGDGKGGEMQMPDHFHIHIPVVDNPDGPLAMTNPNFHCPPESGKSMGGMDMNNMQGMDMPTPTP